MQLELQIKSYIKINKHKSIIIIKTSKDLRYGTYRQIVKTIKNSITKLRAEMALKYFKKAYSDLSIQEKENMDKQYPIIIFESISD